MKEDGPGKDASEARYLRKHYKQGGFDEEQEQEDKNFKEDLEKALNNYSKKAVTKDVEKQIEYFGYKMEPFNMREEQEMGDIDQDGYFVFNDKKRARDPWLDSLNEDGEEAIDTLRKKIKMEQRERNVFEADRKLQEDDKSDEEQKENEEGEGDQVPEGQQIVEENKLKPDQIKLLLSELLPFGSSANQYMKKLKKEKDTELYDKVLFLCNEYIAATGEHDILTLKKQDLQEQAEEVQQQQPLNNWDKDSSEQRAVEKKEDEQDDIF